MTDKDIYNISSNIRSNVENLSGAFTTASKLIKARQSSMIDKLSDTGDLNGGKKLTM